jgi:hypothetical protein
MYVDIFLTLSSVFMFTIMMHDISYGILHIAAMMVDLCMLVARNGGFTA